MNEKKKVTDERSFITDEYRANFHVTVKRKKVWKIELDCFRQFKRICEEHNLRYFLIGGSLLGAVRHSGFIPWDDDMDVAMMRNDYNRFLDIAAKELHPPFSIQATGCDNEFFRDLSRVCHSSSTALVNGQWSSKTKRNCGIFLDILPVDAVPSNKIAKMIHKRIGRLLTVTTNSWILNIDSDRGTVKGEARRMIRCFLRLFPAEVVAKIRDKWIGKYNNKPHNEVGILSVFYHDDRWIWDRRLFDDVEPCDFEYETATMPKGWVAILEKTYGDWQTPVQGASCHEGSFFDPDKPYTYYITQFDKFKTLTPQKNEW